MKKEIIMVGLVNLKSKKGDRIREYQFDHAAAILKHEAQIGYEGHKLPDDSKYIFTDGELIERTSAQIDKGATQSARNKPREIEEGKA